MDKAHTYIEPYCKTVLLPLLLAIGLSGFGQGPDSLPPTIDTSITIVEDVAQEDNSRFETITADELQPVTVRPVNKNQVVRLKKDEAFWYINVVPEKEKRPVKQKLPEKRQDPEWVRNLLWVLVVGGFVVLIVWFLMASGVQLFRKSPSAVPHQEGEDEYSTENLFDIDYDSAIKRATAGKNFPLAIRLLYLQTLRELALRNIIQYRQERTNTDYLMQLFHTAYYKDFFRLTRNFEYAWYGQFQVSQPSFEQIKNEFSSFKQRLPS